MESATRRLPAAAGHDIAAVPQYHAQRCRVPAGLQQQEEDVSACLRGAELSSFVKDNAPMRSTLRLGNERLVVTDLKATVCSYC